MTTCNKILQAEGRPYPRTCGICGLGPCSVAQTFPPVKTDDQANNIISLVKSPAKPVSLKEQSEFIPNPLLIKTIQDFMDLAKSGKIDHFAAVGYSSVDNEVFDGWLYPEDCRAYTMLGAITSLQFDVTNLTISRRPRRD